MSKDKRRGGLVYSTEWGRVSPVRRQATEQGIGKSTSPRQESDGIIRLHRETKGRGGKAVTVIRGLSLESTELKNLAKALKQKCGVGGALKEGNIEIQGDQRPVIKAELERRGFTVKIAGG